MLKKYYLSNQQIKELQIYCRSIKVNFLASVFDLESLNL